MSAHRQDYLTANAPRRRLQDQFENRVGQTIAVALLVVVAVASAIAHMVKREEPVVTPVRSPEVVQYQLPPMEIADARLEGFRAGFDAAMEQACRTPTLTYPIATR